MGKGVVFLIGGERCISLLTAGSQPDMKFDEKQAQVQASYGERRGRDR